MTTAIPTICHGCGSALSSTVFCEGGEPYHFGCRPSQQVILSRVGCMFCPDKDARIAALEEKLASAIDGFWRREEECEALAERLNERDARIAELEAEVAQRDEALTIAYRLALQDAWLDLRGHLEPFSLDFKARAEEGSEK